MFSVFISPSPRAGPLMSRGVPGRPAGCDRDGAPSGFKWVTERAGQAPAATGAISLLPRVPATIVTSAAVEQCASGASLERIWLSHVARSLQKEPQMEKTGGVMETEGRRQRQTGGPGDESEMVSFGM